MQIPDILDRLCTIVEQAKSVPLIKGAIIDRDEVLDLLDTLRAELPTEIDQADVIIADRSALLADAQNKADEMLAEAQRQVQRLLSENSLVTNAHHEIAATRGKVETELTRLRNETDEYIDARLATFEVALARTMAAIQRGRERLNGRHPYDALAPADEAELVKDDLQRANSKHASEPIDVSEDSPTDLTDQTDRTVDETGPITRPISAAS